VANTIAPFGAQDVTHVAGSQRTEELEAVWIPSSHPAPIFNGDLVVQWTSSLAAGGVGNYISQGSSVTPAAGAYWRGVFRGCEYYNAATQRMLYSRFFPGATLAGTSSATGDVKAWIVSDPNYQFIVQTTSGASVFGSSNVGMALQPGAAQNGSSVFDSSTNGNYITGNSGMGIQSAAALVGSSAPTKSPFRLVDFFSNRAPGNWMQQPGVGGSGAFVNGTDNTVNGQLLIVEPLDWDRKAL
jgi:hypothetical protein